LRIQGKLTVTLIGIGLLAAAATAGVSIYMIRQSLIEKAFDQLTSVRRSKGFQIESYFRTVNHHIQTLSESIMVSEALHELGSAYEQYDAGGLDEPKRQDVLQYYDQVYLPELKKFVDLRSSVLEYTPKTPAGIRLQWHFLVQNPYPPGRKDQLLFATEHTGEKLCPYCAAHSRFHRSFKRLIDRFGYYDMFLVDQQGRIVYTVVKEPDFGTSLLTGPYKDTGMARITKECLKANDSNTVILSDYEEYEPSRGKPSAFVCAPVMNTQTGKRFGAMIIQLSNKEIDRVVSGNRGWVRDGLGQSGDTGVVGPDYLIRSNARGFIEDPEKHLAGMRKRGDPEKQITRTQAYSSTALLLEVRLPSVEAALQGKSGAMMQRGRSGNMSLVAFAPLDIPGVKWTIGTRVDAAETLAPVNRLIRNLILMTLLVIAVTALAAFFAGKSIVTPVLSLAGTASRVAGGDTSARAEVSSKDEIGALATTFNSMLESLDAKARIIDQKNHENEALLLNILPEAIATRLKSGEGTIADHFAEVTVLFADIVGFTVLSSKIPPGEVVEFLNQLFTRYDALAHRLGVEKIKTIGDAYMAVAGVPAPATDHARRVAELALGIVDETGKFGAEMGLNISVRVGVNSGPVVAGVIGTSKFIYDLWGDTVNVASRMESHGEPGRVQVTRPVYEALKDEYSLSPRGTIEVKGKGAIETWILSRNGSC